MPADDLGTPQSPTREDLTDGIVRLLAEVNDAFSSNRWAILDRKTDRVKWLLYDGAALRHCCRLLYEIEIAAKTDQEFGSRLLARAHLEAWIVGLFIHYGGYECLKRVGQDTLHSLVSMDNDAKQFDKWLSAEQKKARRSARKIEQANQGIGRWNEANPELPAKPFLDVPYVPKLRSTGVDLSDRITAFGACKAQPLSVSDMIDALTKLGPVKGFGKESFRPIYIIYRVLSAIGTHATLNILDAYFVPGTFIRLAPFPVNGSITDNGRITALYGTAFLASAVLGEQGCSTPVADDIGAWLAPDPSGRSAWSPGI